MIRSSGNHDQGVAYAARMHKVPAYIVMPESSSKVKIAAAKDYGASKTFCEPSMESRVAEATKVNLMMTIL